MRAARRPERSTHPTLGCMAFARWASARGRTGERAERTPPSARGVAGGVAAWRRVRGSGRGSRLLFRRLARAVPRTTSLRTGDAGADRRRGRRRHRPGLPRARPPSVRRRASRAARRRDELADADGQPSTSREEIDEQQGGAVAAADGRGGREERLHGHPSPRLLSAEAPVCRAGRLGGPRPAGILSGVVRRADGPCSGRACGWANERRRFERRPSLLVTRVFVLPEPVSSFRSAGRHTPAEDRGGGPPHRQSRV